MDQGRKPVLHPVPGLHVLQGEVAVSSGAVLTIEPGVAVCVNKISVDESGRNLPRAQRLSGWLRRPKSSQSMGGHGFSVSREYRHDFRHERAPACRDRESVRRRRGGPSDHRRGHFDTPRFIGEQAAQTRRLGDRRVCGSTRSDSIAWRHSTESSGSDDYRRAREYSRRCGTRVTAVPALLIQISDETPPLVVSARVINSWGPGVVVTIRGLAKGVSQTLLTNCEISGSAEVGLYVDAETTDQRLARIVDVLQCFGQCSAGSQWRL